MIADALTRRPQDSIETRDNLNRILIPGTRFKGVIHTNETIIEQIQDSLEEDLGGEIQHKGGVIVVPDKEDLRQRILKWYHEGATYSHPGVKGTEEKIK